MLPILLALGAFAHVPASPPFYQAVMLGASANGTSARPEKLPVARLTWLEGPKACGTPAEFEQAVTARLGREGFVTASTADVEVSVRFEAGGERGWRVTLAYVNRAGRLLGERVLQTPADHCVAIRDAAALVVAMFLEQPRLRSEVSIPEPDYPPTSWTLKAGLAGTSVPGLAPSGGIGVGLSVWAVHPQKQSLFLRFTQSLKGDVDDPELPASATVDLVSVQLGGCPWSWLDAPWSLSACGSLNAGLMSATGQGFETNRNVNLPAFGGGFFARIESWLWPNLGLALDLGAAGWLYRPRLNVEHSGESRVLFHPWPVTPTLAVELVFGGS